jgi:hypothetical protein
VEPAAVTVTEEAFDQALPPPVSSGAVGAIVSSLTVAEDVQADVNPALSTERNCTKVMPSALIEADAPPAAADHVDPPSVEVWYW